MQNNFGGFRYLKPVSEIMKTKIHLITIGLLLMCCGCSFAGAGKAAPTKGAVLSPSQVNFGSVKVGTTKTVTFTVSGATFSSGEVSIDGQSRASFFATKNSQSVEVLFTPMTSGQMVARLKILIESDGPPYYIFSLLQGVGI